MQISNLPVLQLELMRNIHFQSLIPSSSTLALPGSGLTSLPSTLPIYPLTPLSLALPYSLKYNDFHNYALTECVPLFNMFTVSIVGERSYVPDCRLQVWPNTCLLLGLRKGLPHKGGRRRRG